MTDKSLGKILDTYSPIQVTGQEQFELGANVFNLGGGVVIAQKRHERLYEEITNQGFTVEPIDFSETARLGGAFRCTTCPIERETESEY